jgi:hypothetical protein
MNRDNIVRLFSLIAAIILLATPAHAQSTGTIEATVLDAHSAR